MKYKQGQFFFYQDDIYVLATCNLDSMTLISLKTGNRFCNPVDVQNTQNVTKKEFIAMGGNNMRPLTKPILTVKTIPDGFYMELEP